MSAREVEDEKGNFLYYESIVEDVSERRMRETRLEKLAESLARSNKDLEGFAHVVSHDLKEPLRMITLHLHFLETHLGERVDPKAQEHIVNVNAATRRMWDLINDLLDYSQVSNQNVSFTEVDCNSVLQEALQNMHSSIGEGRAELILSPLPKIWAHPTQLMQLFQNLITNAIKFRSKDRHPLITISSEERGSEWILSVSDNGIGIESRYFDIIFGSFKRLHSYTEYPGTGMGLSICKRIMENHNGKIFVESKIGHGTTFFVSFPKRSPSLALMTRKLPNLTIVK